MNSPKPQDLIDQLDKLLESERTVLLKGEIDEIPTIAEQKEALIDALNAIKTNETCDLEQLQRKVSRNQILLDGALHGIRNVAMRLAALRKIRRSLETYDASGNKQSIPGEIFHRMEKRA